MKRFLATLLAALIIMSMAVTGAFAASPDDFSDIPDNWAREGIIKAIENGLLAGTDGKILPYDNLTRAQLAAILNRSFKASDAADISSYTDVPANSWFYSDIAVAVGMGTFTGSGNTMRPNAPITREEAFTVLARAFQFTQEDASGLSAFSDSANISEWAKSSIAALVSEGYIEGSGGKINPKSYITRAEFATIMNRLVSEYISTPGEVTQVTGKNIMINTTDVTLSGVTVTGNIYIGDGVGDGSVTLKDVICEDGMLLIRGGGENTVTVGGTSRFYQVMLARQEKVRLFLEKQAKLRELIMAKRSKDAILEGSADEIKHNADNATLYVKNGTVTSAQINGTNSTIVVEQGTNVGQISANGSGATISGPGTVGKVIENALNVKVETENTDIEMGPGATGPTGEPKPNPNSGAGDTPDTGTGVGSRDKITDVVFNGNGNLGEVSVNNNTITMNLSSISDDTNMSTVKIVATMSGICNFGYTGSVIPLNSDYSITELIKDVYTALNKSVPSTTVYTMGDIRLLFGIAYIAYQADPSTFTNLGITMLNETTATIKGNTSEAVTYNLTLNVGAVG